jgi:hypothetical protein
VVLSAEGCCSRLRTRSSDYTKPTWRRATSRRCWRRRHDTAAERRLARR